MINNPTPPTVDMWPGDPSEDQAPGGFGEIFGSELITVRVRVSSADNFSQQDLLLALMDDEDPLSLVLAVTDDPTINGLGQIGYRSRSGFTLFPDPSGEGFQIGCLFVFEVIKAHS